MNERWIKNNNYFQTITTISDVHLFSYMYKNKWIVNVIIDFSRS